MDSVKNAGSYLSESAKGMVSGGSYETNKQTATNSQAPLGDRATAAKDAVSDKAHQTGHDASASANKEAAKH